MRPSMASISNELGIIGEKVVADWFASRKYPFVHFGYHSWAGYHERDWEEGKLLTPKEKAKVRSLLAGLRRIRCGRPDYLVRMPELTLVEVKVNRFETARKRKALLALAKRCGFNVMTAYVEIGIGPVVLTDYDSK